MQPHYDYKTGNPYFLGMSRLLHELGISNSYFFLMLYDKDLIGVDPHNPNLSLEMQQKISVECIRNFWYFFRECWRYPSESGAMSKFKLDIGSLATLYLQRMGFNTYTEKPRQTGKTIADLAHIARNFNFESKNSKFGIYNYDDEKVKENLQRILLMLDSLPGYLRWHTLKSGTDKDGNFVITDDGEAGKHITTFVHKINKNSIVAKTCGQSPASANKTGKGGTQPVQFWDEPGAINYIELAFGSGFPAQSTAAANARLANLPNYIGTSTTPPSMDTEHGKYLYKFFKEESLKFEPFMFDKSKDELKLILSKNAKRDFFFITFQYFELGYDENWVLEQRRKLSDYIFQRDVLLRWMKDYSKSPFTKAELDTLEHMIAKHSYKAYSIKEHYIMKIYDYKGMTPDEVLHYFANRKLSIGIDMGAGLGGERDSSTLVGSCPETGKTIMTFKTNFADTFVFADIVHYITTTYFPEALLVIERNSYGQSLIDNLSKTEIEKNMYYTDITPSMILAKVMPNKKGKYMYGVFNVNEIRHTLYNVMLMDIMRNKKHVIVAKDIFEEISMLVTMGDKITHVNGKHDDLTMGKMFSLYPLLYDTNLLYEFRIPNLVIKNDNEEFEAFKELDRGVIYDIEDDIKKLSESDVMDMFELLRTVSLDNTLQSNDKKYRSEEGKQSILEKVITNENVKRRSNPWNNGSGYGGGGDDDDDVYR